MELTLGVTIFVGVVVPLIGWVFNALITKKIDSIIEQQDRDRELFFKRLDEEKLNVDSICVRKDMYEQSMKHHKENEDAVFKSFLSIVNTQFQNLENKLENINEKLLDKVQDIKELEIKIDDLKEFMDTKLK